MAAAVRLATRWIWQGADAWVERAVLGQLPPWQERALNAGLATALATALACALLAPAWASLPLLGPPVVICFFKGRCQPWLALPILLLHHLLVGSLLADFWFLLALLAGSTFAIVTVNKFRQARKHGDELVHSLEVARQVQRSLEPPVTQEWGGLEVATVLKPSETLGGDFVCLRPVGHDRFGIVLGDVMGKGVRASLAAAFVTGLYGELAREGFGPAAILEIANHRLCDFFDRFNLFVTIAAVEYDPGRQEWRVALAGHEAPILVRREGLVEDVPQRGMAAGIHPEEHYQDTRLPARPGDQIFVASDGLLPIGPRPDLVPGLMQATTGQPVDVALEGMVARLAADVHPGHPDDTTAVLIRLPG